MSKSRARIKQTGEVFTPHELCLDMVKGISEKILQDPTSTYLDPCCGDGNFLVALLEVLTLEYGHERDHVVNHQLYGVDIMDDNIEVTKSRLGAADDHPHFVCHDALTYDYSFE